MATLGTAFIPPVPTVGQFGFYLGAEDNTAGTQYWTSDQSGYAHVGYGRVDVVAGTTIGGTTYGTANRNDFGVVAPSARIVNFFPLTDIVRMSIRRGRTRPDQWDDVGECTVEVLNTSGASDPDNTTGRYQRLVAPTVGTAGSATANYGSWLKPGVYGQIVWGNAGTTATPLFTGVLEAVEPTDDVVSTAVFTFVDRMAIIGRTTLGNGVKAGAVGDTGKQRLKLIADSARIIDVVNGNGGVNTVEQVLDIQGFSRRLQLGSTGDTALDAMKTVVAGEAGRIFANRSGVVSVWDRAKMASTAAGTAATFSDTPATVTGYGYDEIHTNQGQNFVYNSAVVKVGDRISATAKIDESVAQYGERRAEIECALQTDGDALALAVFYATNWSNPTKAVASFSLQAYAYSQAQFDVLAALDLQQSVRVYRKLPGGRTLDVKSVIEGIEIDLDPSTRRFTFYLSPVDTTTISWPV